MRHPLLLAAALAAFAPAQAAQSVAESNKAIVLEVFRALESGDLAALNRAFSPDGRSHINGETGPPRGTPKSFAEAAPFPGALSDRSVVTAELLAEDDLVAIRSRICGRHTEAPLMGVAPTGKRICSDYINIYRFEDGRIIDNYVGTDRRKLELQLRTAP